MYGKKKRKNERKKRREEGKNASTFCPPWIEEEKKKEQRAQSESVAPRKLSLSCRCSCAPPISSPPSSMALFRSLETFSTSRRQRERESVRVVDKRGTGGVCLQKFQTSSKKLHWRPASAVKHKANYRLNIFRYILSCRDRRGLRSLFLSFLNHPLFPFLRHCVSCSCRYSRYDEPDGTS